MIISKKGHVEQGEFIVKIPTKKYFMRRLIANPYVLGYDTIKVTFEDLAVLDKIQEITDKYLLGFEIVSQGKDYCIIKNVARGIESEFQQLFNRQFIVLLSFGKELGDAFRNKDFERLSSILKYEETLNKLGYFCKRMLNTAGYAESEKTRALYNLTSICEMAGDLFRYITIQGIEKKPALSKNTLDYFDKINDLLELSIKKLKALKVEELKGFREKRIYIRDVGKKLLNKPAQDAFIIHNLMAIGELTHHMTDEIV